MIPRTPLVTVAIPAYNRPEFVCKAVESALAQNVDGLEVLVVDDVSGDGAWETLQEFARVTAPRYPAAELRIVRNDTNLGLFGNFNRCLELARGEYVRILCNDDRLVPDCLAYECALMQEHPGAALLSSKGWFLDEQGQRTEPLGDILPPGIYNGKDMVAAALSVLAGSGCSVFSYPAGVMMRREAIHKAGWFETGMKHLGDMDYFLKIAQQGDVVISARDGCEVRQHEGAITSTLVAEGHFTEEWFLMADKWADYLPTRQQHRRIVEQCAAYSLALAFYFLRRRQPVTARTYWQAAQRGNLSPLAWVGAVREHMRARALRQRGQALPGSIRPYAAIG